MEKRLYCDVALSLEEIALRNVTINLWNESILDAIQKRANRWYVIEVLEEMVKSKVSKLLLLDSLKKRIMRLVQPIGLDIMHWIYCHEYNDFFVRSAYDMRILLQLRRTWVGAIDYRKTAEEFVHLEKLAVWDRFLLASLFCLEDKIPLLWGKLPEYAKSYYCERYKKPFYIIHDTQMMNYWCSFMREDEWNLERTLEKEQLSKPSFYKHALSCAAMKGNKAATEYFFQKLANEEGDFLLRTVDDVLDDKFWSSNRTLSDFPHEKLTDVLCYLLTVMTPEQQMQVFKKYPFEVLCCFLYWPLEYLFVDIAELCWGFLPESSYGSMPSSIRKCIKRSGSYFPNWFNEFFLRCPSSFRKFFVSHESQTGTLLREFFLTQDTETVRVIFENLDAGDRARILVSEPVFKLLNDFIWRDSWNIVEVCIRAAALSEENRTRLKEGVSRYMSPTDSGARRRRFFELLDERDASTASDKDEPPAKVKKLCSG